MVLAFRFLTFDPYLTFAEGERGFREKIFLNSNGESAEKSYGGGRNGGSREQWYKGRSVYSVIAEKIGEQPDKEALEQGLKDIHELEYGLLQLMQSLASEGRVIFTRPNGEPISDFASYVEHAELGSIMRTHMDVFMPLMASGALADNGVGDFEVIFNLIALKNLDDYRVAAQIGHGNDLTSCYLSMAENMASAELYKTVMQTSKEAISAMGRRSASARHKPSNELKAKVLSEWDATGDSFSSVAAFARIKLKEYGKEYQITDDRTISNWVREHLKTKKE